MTSCEELDTEIRRVDDIAARSSSDERELATEVAARARARQRVLGCEPTG